MSWRKQGSPGFVLLEMVVALFLFSFLFVLAVPTLAHLQRKFTLLGCAHQVAGIIRLAQIEAIEGETQTKVTFDIVGNRVIFRGKDNTSTKYTLPGGVFLYTTNFPSHELSFLPQGTPLCGGTVVLRTKTVRKYVIVAPVTGRVRVSDTPPI